MQSDTKKGATTVLTETDMVAGLTATSRRKCEPGVLVSRDHPFISGFMGASTAGGSCCTGTAGSAKTTSESGRLVASFLQPKKRLSGCFSTAFEPGERVRSALPQHMLGKAAAAPVSSPRPIALRRNRPVRRELALA